MSMMLFPPLEVPDAFIIDWQSTASIIFFACFVILWISSGTRPSDPQFALLTIESPLSNRTPSLNKFKIPGLDPLTLPA
jgi:hypothetical protein